MIITPAPALAEDGGGSTESSSSDSNIGGDSPSGTSDSSTDSGTSVTDGASYEPTPESSDSVATVTETTSSNSETLSTESADLQNPPEQPSDDYETPDHSGDPAENNETISEESTEPAEVTTGGETGAEPASNDLADEDKEEKSAEGNSYVATITPDAVVDGDTTSYPDFAVTGLDDVEFTVTFTEVGDKEIGSAQMKMPDLNGDNGFRDFAFDPTTIQTSSGQAWYGKLDLVDSLYYLNLWALSADDCLQYGEWVSATFTATTPDTDNRGAYEFETKAWTNAAEGFNGIGSTVNNMAVGYSDPVVIVGKPVANVSDLVGINNNIDSSGEHYVQVADIELGDYLVDGGDGYNDGKGWVPIGCNNNRFTGSYHGNDYTISELFINRADENHLGLFGFTGPGVTLTNIALKNVDVTGRSRIGGLVGYNYGGTISNSYTTGTVTGSNYYESRAGGLVGWNNGTITNSHATGAVTGEYYVGGMAGQNNGIITNSHAAGTIIGFTYVGGMVGQNNGGTIANSYATGTVTGNNSTAGGLVGWNDYGVITNSYATGTVTGNISVGGLVGWNRYGNIANSYAAGAVTGNNSTGGLVGLIHGGAITNSYATGTVTSNGHAGGIVGYNYVGNISNSHATGAVTGNSNNSNAGGMVGWNNGGSITNSYATGTVTCNGDYSHAGGLAGQNNGTITNSYTTGTVTCNGDYSHAGGLVGWNNGGTITNSYFNTETTKQSKGVGSDAGHSGVTGLTTAKMKNAANYGGWSMTTTTLIPNKAEYEPYPFPVLFWELGADENPVWYIYPTNEGDSNTSSFGGGSIFSGYKFTLSPLPVTSRGLTAISGKGANPIITSPFVTGGNAADLGRAIAAYKQAKQSYEENKSYMDAADKAVAETELAVANAAIIALEFTLAAQSGSADNFADLIATYNAARAVFNSSRVLLTTEQVDETEALLNAIAKLINSFSS